MSNGLRLFNIQSPTSLGSGGGSFRLFQAPQSWYEKEDEKKRQRELEKQAGEQRKRMEQLQKPPEKSFLTKFAESKVGKFTERLFAPLDKIHNSLFEVAEKKKEPIIIKDIQPQETEKFTSPATPEDDITVIDPYEFTLSVQKSKQEAEQALMVLEASGSKDFLGRANETATRLLRAIPFMEAITDAFPTQEVDKRLKAIDDLKETIAIYNEVLTHGTQERGFWEGMNQRINEGFDNAFKPFVGQLENLAEVKNVLEISKKIEEGTPLSPYEEALTQKVKAEEMESLLSRGLGYAAADAIIQMPNYALEFAATGGVYESTKLAVTNAVSKTVLPKAVSKMAGVLVGTAAQTAIMSGAKIAADTANYMIPNHYYVASEEGNKIVKALNEEKEFTEAFGRAYGHAFIETLTERAGKLIHDPVQWLSKATLGKFLTKVGIHGMGKFGWASNIAAKIGWDGIIEEVFEEELANILNATLEGRALFGKERVETPAALPTFGIPKLFGIDLEEKYPNIFNTEGAIERLFVEGLSITAFAGIGQAMKISPNLGKKTTAPPVEIKAEVKTEISPDTGKEVEVGTITQPIINQEGRRAGQLQYTVHSDGRVSLDDLFVDKHDRNHGYASQAIRDIFDITKVNTIYGEITDTDARNFLVNRGAEFDGNKFVLRKENLKIIDQIKNRPKYNEGKRTDHQKMLEQAQHRRDWQEVERILNDMPDSDPYKKSMERLFRPMVDSWRKSEQTDTFKVLRGEGSRYSLLIEEARARGGVDIFGEGSYVIRATHPDAQSIAEEYGDVRESKVVVPESKIYKVHNSQEHQELVRKAMIEYADKFEGDASEVSRQAVPAWLRSQGFLAVEGVDDFIWAGMNILDENVYTERGKKEVSPLKLPTEKVITKRKTKQKDLPVVVRKVSKAELPVLDQNILAQKGNLYFTDLSLWGRIEGDLEDGIYKSIGKDFYKQDLDIADYPTPPEFEEKPLLEMSMQDLIDFMAKLSPFVGTDDLRPVLKSAYIRSKGGILEGMVTDGFRLDFEQMPIGGAQEFEFMVSDFKTLADNLAVLGGELARIRRGELGGKSYIAFEGETGYLAVPEFVGEFPNVKKVFPSTTDQIALNTSELKSALRDLSSLASGKESTVSLVDLPNKSQIAITAKREGNEKTVYVGYERGKQQYALPDGGGIIPGRLVMPVRIELVEGEVAPAGYLTSFNRSFLWNVVSDISASQYPQIYMNYQATEPENPFIFTRHEREPIVTDLEPKTEEELAELKEKKKQEIQEGVSKEKEAERIVRISSFDEIIDTPITQKLQKELEGLKEREDNADNLLVKDDYRAYFEGWCEECFPEDLEIDEYHLYAERETEKIAKEHAPVNSEIIEAGYIDEQVGANPYGATYVIYQAREVEEKEGAEKVIEEAEEPVKKAVKALVPDTVSSGFHGAFSKEFNGIEPSWAVVIDRRPTRLEKEAAQYAGLKLNIRQPVKGAKGYILTDIYLPEVKENNTEKAKEVFDKFADYLSEEAEEKSVVEQAKELGMDAFVKGVERRPNIDTQLKFIIKDLETEERQAAYKAWLDGWDEANEAGFVKELVEEGEKERGERILGGLETEDVGGYSFIKETAEIVTRASFGTREDLAKKEPPIGAVYDQYVLNAYRGRVVVAGAVQDGRVPALAFTTDGYELPLAVPLDQLREIRDPTENDKGDLEDNIKPSLEKAKIKEADFEIEPDEPDTTEQAFALDETKLSQPLSKAAKEQTDKLVRQQEVIDYISERLNVPIRKGKYRRHLKGGEAWGIYKTKQDVIRWKRGRIATVSHEVGHFLQDTIEELSKKAIGLGEGGGIRDKELRAVTEYTGYGSDKIRSEGFSEWLRLYVTFPRMAVELAPNFNEWFEKIMDGHPGIRDTLLSARADWKRWSEMPSSAKVWSQISFTKGNKETLARRVVRYSGDIYSSVIDDLYPIKQFVEAGKKAGLEIASEENPYISARNLRGWVGKADTFLKQGTFGRVFWKKEGKHIKPVYKGKGLSEILEPVEKAKALEDLSVYLTARRAIDLSKRGIVTGIDRGDAEATLNEMEKAYGSFKRVADELNTYQDHLLRYVQQAGLINKDTYQKIKKLNPFYVPFFRVFENLEERKHMGQTIGNVRSGIKKIRGSEREIINPLESIVKNTYTLINAAERNMVALQMARLANEHPDLSRDFEQVATPISKVATLSQDEVQKTVEQALPSELSDVIMSFVDERGRVMLDEAVINIFRPSFFTYKDHSITVMIDGKAKHYEVEPDLYKAIMALEREHAGAIEKILSYPAKWLRAGATLSPEFMARNPLRDQWTAFVYSKYGFMPGVDLVKGVFSMMGKDETYQLWKMAGGQHSMLVSLDRQHLQKSFEEIVGGKKFTDFIKNPLETMQIISELGEAATRLGEARRALAKTGSPTEAAFASREVTLDFSRIGSKTRALNMITAFWNANVQGMDKLLRQFKDYPGRTLLKTIMGITLPSILLYFVNRDEEKWKEIPQWQKDLFWIFFVGDKIIRIPKPFELGILFGSVPERILEYIDTQDTNLFEELKESILNGSTPDFLPTALQPIIENTTNYDFFLNRPIVPESVEGLPPEAQYTHYTSETAKLIGEAFNYSPAKIDNLINDYTGGLGRHIVDTMDRVLEGTGIVIKIPEPESTLADIPLIKGLIIREPIGSASKSLDQFYNKWEELESGEQFLKKQLEEKNEKKFYGYKAQHPELYFQYDYDSKDFYSASARMFRKVSRDLSELRKTRTLIAQSMTLSPKEKREKLDEIDRLMTKVARDTLDYLDLKLKE